MANKQDLIAKVAEATELTKKDSAAAVDAVFAAVSEYLSKGEKVQLIGLVTSKFVNVQLVKVATHKLVKKSKLQLLKFQHSKLVKLLKTQLNNQPLKSLLYQAF